ncbi:MAG: hypothetical protein AAGP08_12370 [Pseudomonadota bacterium]
MALSSIAKTLRLGIVIGFALAATAAAPADEQLVLTPNEMRMGANNALIIGDNKLALEIANALLWRDADDSVAHTIKSRAERNLGRVDAALDSAKDAWRTAETEGHRFNAAMVRAQALATAGNHTASQFWLRRAVEGAPDDETRAVATRDFQYVRARNKWSANFSFNITPSSNVNNGSSRDSFTLSDNAHPILRLLAALANTEESNVSGAAQALEGLEYSGGVVGRYRFSQTETYAHDITFRANYRTYTLSDDAKAQAPGVSGSDFAFGETALGYTFHNTPENWIGPYSLSVMGGRTWYAGDPYFDFLRLGGTQIYKLSDRAALSFHGSAERRDGLQIADSDNLRGDVRFRFAVSELGVAALTLGHTKSMSNDTQLDYTEWRGGIDFTLAKPVLGTRVSFGVTVSERAYDVSIWDMSGRDDFEVGAHVDVVFTELEHYGFNPTITIKASETDSNIGRFDANRVGVQFGIRSAF